MYDSNTYSCVIDTPVGKMGVDIAGDFVVRVAYLSASVRLIPPRDSVSRRVVSEIRQYFCDPAFKFSVAIELRGTILQKKIWDALQTIPVGVTKTYGELAQIVATSPRVIGNACGRNPIPLIVPCHRVVAAMDIGGYCGGNSDPNFMRIKRWLLTHEAQSKSRK